MALFDQAAMERDLSEQMRLRAGNTNSAGTTPRTAGPGVLGPLCVELSDEKIKSGLLAGLDLLAQKEAVLPRETEQLTMEQTPQQMAPQQAPQQIPLHLQQMPPQDPISQQMPPQEQISQQSSLRADAPAFERQMPLQQEMVLPPQQMPTLPSGGCFGVSPHGYWVPGSQLSPQMMPYVVGIFACPDTAPTGPGSVQVVQTPPGSWNHSGWEDDHKRVGGDHSLGEQGWSGGWATAKGGLWATPVKDGLVPNFSHDSLSTGAGAGGSSSWASSPSSLASGSNFGSWDTNLNDLAGGSQTKPARRWSEDLEDLDDSGGFLSPGQSPRVSRSRLSSDAERSGGTADVKEDYKS